MGTCLSKKKGSSTTAPAAFERKNPSGNGVTVCNSKVVTEPEVKLKKENKKVHEKHESVVEQEVKGQVKKEIFIIKHRKSHDDRERYSKGISAEQNAPQSGGTANIEATELLMGVRTSSCTKEEVDAILIHCGRLSRNSSGKYRFSGSKRSHDFDNCDNDTISTEEEYQKKANAADNNGLMEDASEKRHRQSPRSVSKDGGRRRRRTPSREREEKQRSSSRERRVSRSPVRRSSENPTTPANARNNNTNITSSKPGKMVSVPATVSSLVMDKSNNNNGGGGGGGGESAGIKRITVRRNVGAASPRSQSPARASGNAANGNKVLSENQQQQQPSLSRNNSRKAEQSPYRRNPLSEVEPNSLSFPHSATNNNNSRVQNRPKKEVETEANQKPNASRIALDKGVGVNCKTKVQQEEDVKVQSPVTDNVVVMTVVPPIVDNLKPQTLTRSRSSRRSRDLDLNPEALLIPPQSYTSLLLEDIQNFHQKNTPPVSIPACVTRACTILEAVADLNSNTSSNFSGRNQYNVLGTTTNVLGTTTNDHMKRVPNTKDPIVESELVVYDDVMEPSLHKYVTVNRGGSDMEDQESSGSNGFTVSSGKQWRGISSSSSWEPSSTDSKDCWTSRLNNCREEGQKSQLVLEGRVSSEAGRAVDGAKEKLNSKRREFDHQHDSGRLGGNNVLHTKPVVTGSAAASKYR